MTGATGVDATHFGSGTDNNVNIVVRNVAITTMNDYDSLSLNSPGILGARDGGGSGRVTIDVQGGTITTEGTEAYGIYGRNTGTGDIGISVRGGTITTESTGISRGVGALAHGVFGWQQAAGTGAVTITATGGSITTKGSYSNGIYGVHQGDGDITITTAGDNAITTAGDNAHGVVAYHYGTMDSRTIAVTVGGTISAGGENAIGVRVGALNAQGEVIRAAGMDADGYRRQTVTVNGAVMGGTGAGAGVWLAGGGRVVIGPKGSVGAASGIAILATGDTPVENGEPLKPRLHVSMNLDGRRVAAVFGDDWIVNDGGETTIVVNNVKLHDGAAGVTGLTAPNGARDVSQRSAGVIADRDFSADDFTETPKPETPEEPTEKPKTPVRIIEVYAPRAAVYEALPGLLLGLTGGGRDGARLSGGRRRYGSDQRSAYDFKRLAADYESLPGVFRLGGSPVWVRLSGGKGSYKSGEASVGAAYDFRRLAAEAGVDVAFPWNKDITGTVSVRHVQASAEVSSPTGGGDVDAKGFGAGLGVSWGGASGYYVDGRLSVTGYKLDLSSDKRGRLKGDVGALAHSLSIEAGRRIALGTRMSLTPRARLVRSGVSMDRFTDAVNSRVKLTDPKQLKGVVGLVAETGRVRDGGSFSLRGSVDVERTLRGGATAVEVSGEKLRSEPERTRVLLGLGGVWCRGRFSIGIEATADGPGSDEREYAGQINLGIRF